MPSTPATNHCEPSLTEVSRKPVPDMAPLTLVPLILPVPAVLSIKSCATVAALPMGAPGDAVEQVCGYESVVSVAAQAAGGDGDGDGESERERVGENDGENDADGDADGEAYCPIQPAPA